MMQGYHCMDDSTVHKEIDATVSSYVHQINATLDFKIPRALLSYIYTIIPYSGNEF